MKRKNMARNALFTSVISLLLCVSMLVGTTFAWFTDEVKSGNNLIAAGNLDVELYHSNVKDAREAVDGSTVLFNEVTNNLWEPGALAYENFEVVNAGSLALKYKMSLKALSQSVVNGNKLGDVIKVGFKQGGFTSTTREGVIGEVSEWKPLTEYALNKNGVKLTAGGSDTFGLVLYWQPNSNDVDNLYNVPGEALYLTVGIELYATQVEHETDSFGIDYDQLAVYPGTGMGNLPENNPALEIPVLNEDKQNVGSILVPEAAIEDPSLPVEVIYSESNYEGNFTVADDQETLVVDVKVLNLKEDNKEPIKATLKIPAGLDPTTVKLYHYSDPVECTYNPNTGDVTFYVTSFSPFTVVYDAESEYVPPVVDENDLPKANVTPYTDTQNIKWGSYGQWSPTAGLEANLEAAYTFSCIDDLDAAKASDYANWYCDFYVKLDKDLGANQIFLGGNYGSFGWVGFHNGNLTLAANEEIPLLGSVTSNPWTYVDVVQNVGEFICGVGDVDDALAGATFTVMLRLTNPENENEYYNVETINYTFAGTTVDENAIDTVEELQAAVAAGGEIVLGGNINMGSTALTVAKDVTLDLNGNVLSGTCNVGQGYLIMVNNGATLDVKDTSAAQNGKITYAKGDNNTGWTIDLEGKLNLYSGTIELTGEDWSIGYAVDVRPNAWGSNYATDTVFHMYGGKVVSSDGAIRVASSSSDSYGNIVASFVMDGGSVNAAWDGVFVQQSNEAYDTLNVAINGGTVTSALSPIRVYGPTATSVNAGTAKPMTIAAANSSLVMNGTPDATRVWHTEGKIVIGGGMTLNDLNQYATITLN